jgi:hypothetical protein
LFPSHCNERSASEARDGVLEDLDAENQPKTVSASGTGLENRNEAKRKYSLHTVTKFGSDKAMEEEIDAEKIEIDGIKKDTDAMMEIDALNKNTEESMEQQDLFKTAVEIYGETKMG